MGIPNMILAIVTILIVLSSANDDYILLNPIHEELGTTSSYQNEIHLLDYAFHPPQFAPKPDSQPFQKGSHGELWHAERKNSSSNKSSNNQRYILKKMYIHDNQNIFNAGKREIHHGERVNAFYAMNPTVQRKVVKFVEHFITNSTTATNTTESFLWLVYIEHGKSLRDFLYKPKLMEGGSVMMEPSDFWVEMRRSAAAHSASPPTLPRTIPSGAIQIPHSHSSSKTPTPASLLMRRVLSQIISGAAHLEQLGITHRDLKPANILCRFHTSETSSVDCVLGDLSSAVDDVSVLNFYKTMPSQSEITIAYAPPEVIFGSATIDWGGYDSWSLGVVVLEILLGTPNVFSVDQRTKTIMKLKLGDEISETDFEKSLFLAALSDYCIFDGNILSEATTIVKSCTLSDFKLALLQRDQLELGFAAESSDELLDLIWKLLRFDPASRLTPTLALSHPYFSEAEVEVEQCTEDNEHLLKDINDNDNDNDNENNKALTENEFQKTPTTKFSIDDVLTFTCKSCKKKFHDFNSCKFHTTARNHGDHCHYGPADILPKCLSAHVMLPFHADSGYCDIKGRREKVEDFHSIVVSDEMSFYGIFDGHNGNLCSKFSASSLHKRFEFSDDILDDDEKIATMVKSAFAAHNEKFVHRHGFTDNSGSTATAVMKVSERSERAFWKTRILAMKCAKIWLQT